MKRVLLLLSVLCLVACAHEPSPEPQPKITPGVQHLLLTPQHILTIAIQGQGKVDPAGGAYDEGAKVTLTAVPESGWLFSDWSGDLTGSNNPEAVVMNSDKNVTASFVRE